MFLLLYSLKGEIMKKYRSNSARKYIRSTMKYTTLKKKADRLDKFRDALLQYCKNRVKEGDSI
jgi:hypothetical protein